MTLQSSAKQTPCSSSVEQKLLKIAAVHHTFLILTGVNKYFVCFVLLVIFTNLILLQSVIKALKCYTWTTKWLIKGSCSSALSNFSVRSQLLCLQEQCQAAQGVPCRQSVNSTRNVSHSTPGATTRPLPQPGRATPEQPLGTEARAPAQPRSWNKTPTLPGEAPWHHPLKTTTAAPMARPLLLQTKNSS